MAMSAYTKALKEAAKAASSDEYSRGFHNGLVVAKAIESEGYNPAAIIDGLIVEPSAEASANAALKADIERLTTELEGVPEVVRVSDERAVTISELKAQLEDIETTMLTVSETTVPKAQHNKVVEDLVAKINDLETKNNVLSEAAAILERAPVSGGKYKVKFNPDNPSKPWQVVGEKGLPIAIYATERQANLATRTLG